MCRSSQCTYSAVKESDTESKAVKLSSKGRKRNDNFPVLEQKEKCPDAASNGKHVQVKETQSKDTISRSTNKFLSTKNAVYQLQTQDISIALATFPEFFPHGMACDQNRLTESEDHSLTNKDLNVRKQNLQSECGGLVLWYIREYGL